MKLDIKDLSICLPFRYDANDRLVNFNTIIRYFDKNFINHEFLILEEEPDDVQHISKDIQNRSDVNYQFKGGEKFLYRNRMLNDLVKNSNRPFVMIYDVDVLVSPIAILETINQLKTKDQFVFPYNGVFINVKNEAKEHMIKTLELPKEYIAPSVKLYSKWGNEFHVIHNRSVGGITTFRRETFLRLGGYNKEILSWGYGDSEIVSRFSTMGYPITRINQPLYHLDHYRGPDSGPNNPHVKSNHQVLLKVQAMDKTMMNKYIKENLI